MEVTFQGAAREAFPCPFRRRLQRVQCLAPATRQLGTGGTRKKGRGSTLASAKPRLRRTTCKCAALVEPPLTCEEDAALLFANFRAHLAQASGPVVARPGLVSGFAHRRQRGLTGRSSGPAAARHQGPVGGTLYIFAIRALASRHCGPLTYNVRPRSFFCSTSSTPEEKHANCYLSIARSLHLISSKRCGLHRQRQGR